MWIIFLSLIILTIIIRRSKKIKRSVKYASLYLMIISIVGFIFSGTYDLVSYIYDLNDGKKLSYIIFGLEPGVSIILHMFSFLFLVPISMAVSKLIVSIINAIHEIEYNRRIERSKEEDIMGFIMLSIIFPALLLLLILFVELFI